MQADPPERTFREHVERQSAFGWQLPQEGDGGRGREGGGGRGTAGGRRVLPEGSRWGARTQVLPGQVHQLLRLLGRRGPCRCSLVLLIGEDLGVSCVGVHLGHGGTSETTCMGHADPVKTVGSLRIWCVTVHLLGVVNTSGTSVTNGAA